MSTTLCQGIHRSRHTTMNVSSYYYVCVLKLLYKCPHTAADELEGHVDDPLTGTQSSCLTTYNSTNADA